MRKSSLKIFPILVCQKPVKKKMHEITTEVRRMMNKLHLLFSKPSFIGMLSFVPENTQHNIHILKTSVKILENYY